MNIIIYLYYIISGNATETAIKIGSISKKEY